MIPRKAVVRFKDLVHEAPWVCLEPKEDLADREAVIFNDHLAQGLLQALQEDNALCELFHFYDKVSGLLTLCLKSDATGELSDHPWATLHFRCSALVFGKVYKWIRVSEHLEIMSSSGLTMVMVHH